MSNSNAEQNDPIVNKLARLYEVSSTIQGIAELQREIDLSRLCDDDFPDWLTQRHGAALIGAVKLLAEESIDSIEDLQSALSGDRS